MHTFNSYSNPNDSVIKTRMHINIIIFINCIHCLITHSFRRFTKNIFMYNLGISKIRSHTIYLLRTITLEYCVRTFNCKWYMNYSR